MWWKKHAVTFAAVSTLTVGSMAAPAYAQSDWAGRIIQGAAIAAQGLFITDAAEIELGRQTAAKIVSQTKVNTDANLKAYVNSVGQAVASRSERTNLPYTFTVLEVAEPNAFATPGGFVFVTTGALKLMQNEAQLAGVLGHEVAHVARKHSVKAIRKAMLAQGVLTTIDPASSQLTAIAATVAANLILKGYDRQAELEADSVGATYALRANYDPRALGTFLDTLARVGGETPAWLLPVADHPRSDDRRARLDRLIATGQIPVRAGLVTNDARFRTQVAGALARPAGGGAGK